MCLKTVWLGGFQRPSQGAVRVSSGGVSALSPEKVFPEPSASLWNEVRGLLPHVDL